MPDGLYQLESEHAKSAKLHAIIILELEGDKCVLIYLKKNIRN